MPLRFVLDENLRGPLWNAICRHNARGFYSLDVVRVGDSADLPLQSADDEILLWTERDGRLLVTEDRNTIPIELDHHLGKGHHCPGIIILPPKCSIAKALSFLEAAAYASEPHEWQDLLYYVS